MAKRLTKEEREKKRKQDLDDWIQQQLKDIPPLTDEQVCKIARIFRGEQFAKEPKLPTAYELEQRQKAQEHAAAIKHAEQLSAAMMACDVCNLSPEAHRFQKSYGGVGFHEWVPGRAQKILDGATR